jgi:hypothetical protein
MGILKILGLSTKHEGQHRPGKHAAKPKPPRQPKGGKK